MMRRPKMMRQGATLLFCAVGYQRAAESRSSKPRYCLDGSLVVLETAYSVKHLIKLSISFGCKSCLVFEGVYYR